MSRPRKTSGRFRGQLGLGQGRPVSYQRPSGAHVLGIAQTREGPLAQFENGRPELRPAEGPRATILDRSYQGAGAVNSHNAWGATVIPMSR